ncbi:hypothetical protein [Dickeya lacustris]|uniref:Uncharacterized protein n=1 Tax=Dickeya lacustris TaxID=2259638 RepID=A0ABY8G5F8_9GAMM|nr:hypothetical protein [Dickeya lacustris]WFN55177.1 hypothetical protein O1Q98_16355 [Dickeya lacustris]
MTQLEDFIVDINLRVKRLEDAVFNGGGGSKAIKKLAELTDELEQLKKQSCSLDSEINMLDKKIDDVIRIVATLKEIIEGGLGVMQLPGG